MAYGCVLKYQTYIKVKKIVHSQIELENLQMQKMHKWSCIIFVEIKE